jgi:hypothetical protein
MHTHALTLRPRWALHLLTAVLALILAALVLPSVSDASDGKGTEGVKASIDDGTLVVKGDQKANEVALRLRAGDASRLELDVGEDGSADRSFARANLSAIKIRTGAGDDSARIDDSNGSFTDSIPTDIGGGADDDTLIGGLGAETYNGGPGNDFVAGIKGNDSASLGAGADTFEWDPGDGSDEIDGQLGRDTMLFNGAAADETVTMSPSGGHLVFVRQPGNVTMVTDSVETVDFNALGGADTITVNNLKGTDVTQTNLDLAGLLGDDTPDGAVDNVIVNATDGDDTINVDGNGSGADVTGLATGVSLTHADPTDRLSVNTGAGNDDVETNGVAGVLQVLIDGIAV